MQQRTEAGPSAQAGWLPGKGSHGSRIAIVRSLQVARGLRPCFLTQQRLLCRDATCEWRQECRRLVAAWKR